MKLFSLKIVFLLLIFSFANNSIANENTIVFDSANASYSKGHYSEAIKQYESLISNNQISAELYYNLGNSYYKMNSIGLAILNYERAKKLDPNMEDLNANLKMANQKTEDKIDAAPQLFISEWKNSIVSIFNEKEWSLLTVFLFTFSLLLTGMYILSQSSGLKKLGFFGGGILLLLAIIIFFLAQHKQELSKYSSDAIITAATATITGSPNDKGTKLFILHEGTKVIITQEEEEWTEIKIVNGNVGWIKNKFLQKI